MDQAPATPTMEPTPVADGSEPPSGTGKKKRSFRLPSAYTILFALIVIAAIATWVVPAGLYELDENGSPVPGTYHSVPSHPARILVDSLTAPINGLYGIEDAKGNINYYNSGTLFGAIDIALFIIVIGGFLGITMKTGAIQAGIGTLVQRMEGRERLLIAAGYDALTGAAVVLLGCGIGTPGSTINPFATGIASGIPGIPISEGLIGR